MIAGKCFTNVLLENSTRKFPIRNNREMISELGYKKGMFSQLGIVYRRQFSRSLNSGCEKSTNVFSEMP